MLILLLIIVVSFVIFPLYCCLAVSTKFDQELEDEQQLKFIEKWNDSNQS